MKIRRFIISALCLCLSFFTVAASASVPSIRNVSDTMAENNAMSFKKYDWYTSRNQIAADHITADMVAGKDYGTFSNELVFSDDIIGRFMGIHYEFNPDNELISTMFVMSEDSSDKVYAQTYVRLFDIYKQEYGDLAFVNNLSGLISLLDDPGGFAASLTRNTSVLAKWDMEDGSTLALLFSGKNGYADVVVTYACPGYYQ